MLGHFQSLFGSNCVYSEKMKAKYIKMDVWKFFCKLAGWHLATSLQINLFTGNFKGFWVNERLRMATSRECLKSICEAVFFPYLVVEIRQLVHEISSFPKVFWKTSQKSQINTRSSHPEVFYQKLFLINLQSLQKNIFAGVCFLIKMQAGNLTLSEATTGDVL